MFGVQGSERLKKRDKPGSFYTVEPDSWSPERGKQCGQHPHRFPSTDVAILECSGH